jgi:enoyl-[acyl-carrier protein] reductase II
MNKITQLFQIQYPIIQGGMVWHSGYKLASAVSNAGGLGLIGAGSMHPELFLQQVQKCQQATQKPFGVNLPLLYPNMPQMIDIILAQGVKIVFTSAGNPNTYTQLLQAEGIKVVHVVSSLKFALKAQDAGVDAVVAEGFEAGGHNGREETTTMCLIPNLKQHLQIPIIAAGGIALGSQIKAAMHLGADAVQMGSRFAASTEASSHPDFKQKITQLQEGDTQYCLKNLTPVRMVKNEFYHNIQAQIAQGLSDQALREFIGKGNAKRGMFEGDLQHGELEIGQVASLINRVDSVADIFAQLLQEYAQSSVADSL